jgi:hypothetical protein
MLFCFLSVRALRVLRGSNAFLGALFVEAKACVELPHAKVAKDATTKTNLTTDGRG